MPQSSIDIEHLSRQTDGDRELERELLMLFSQQCVRLLRTIHGGGEKQVRMDAAHTLKGAARAIGAWTVADAADRIEHALGTLAAGPGDDALDALTLAAAEARATIARLDHAA